MIDRGSRDYAPEIQIFTAEHGEDHYSDDFDVNGRLTFHTYEEAYDWLCRELHKEDPEFKEVGYRTWRAEIDYGPWAEIRQSRITQPRRLLRDDREDE